MDQTRKVVLVIAIVAVVSAAFVGGLYVLSIGHKASASGLPSGCVKPANGYLIIASDGGQYGVGFNGSEEHGAPSTPWPVITVPQGTSVVITVCNIDVQAHSFNIDTYLEGTANTIAPGHIQTFQFVANKTGTFEIYCDIECTIHIFMQGGELRVTN